MCLLLILSQDNVIQTQPNYGMSSNVQLKHNSVPSQVTFV